VAVSANRNPDLFPFEPEERNDMTKIRGTRNLKRASTFVAGVGLTLLATAAPALASYQSWAG